MSDTEKMTIPEAAVEAAARACAIGMWGRYDPDDVPYYLNAVREILEAAAPHMLAEAWDEGMITMHTTTGGEWPLIPEQNPYRPAP